MTSRAINRLYLATLRQGLTRGPWRELPGPSWPHTNRSAARDLATGCRCAEVRLADHRPKAGGAVPTAQGSDGLFRAVITRRPTGCARARLCRCAIRGPSGPLRTKISGPSFPPSGHSGWTDGDDHPTRSYLPLALWITREGGAAT